ncbi:hypothetical protein LCGC14_1435640 [marine sediment metagenome]|uniref:Uncharacterized protein n=1 Tax=marine sediment metagenome TaxID=412755 RepID=A0A0F9JM98_9ZZZZ
MTKLKVEMKTVDWERIIWEESTVCTGWVDAEYAVAHFVNALTQNEMIGRRLFEDDNCVVLVSSYSTAGQVNGYRRIPKRCILHRTGLAELSGDKHEAH